AAGVERVTFKAARLAATWIRRVVAERAARIARGIDAIPRVADGVLGLVPAETAVGLGGGPAGLQVRLDFVERGAGVLRARLPAVFVRRSIVFVVRVTG